MKQLNTLEKALKSELEQILQDLDIHPFMLSRWRKEYREGKLQGGRSQPRGVKQMKQTISKQELKENARLKKENARLKKENELLKKWQRYLFVLVANEWNV